jgi:methylation protein EvaC
VIEFLDLGRQPLANGFCNKDNLGDEYFYDLKVGIDEKTRLVSLINKVDPPKMFNDKYPYRTSGSHTMRQHFANTVVELTEDLFLPTYAKVLEIGSNDGAFIKHYGPYGVCVEPCGNFAKATRDIGIPTFNSFWNGDTASDILAKHGEFDLIYSANCMCHIPDIADAFTNVRRCLKPNGTFVFEDPSLLDVIRRGSYDKFDDEHDHVFSVIAIDKLAKQSDMQIIKVKHLKTHGGSNRFYLKPIGQEIYFSHSVENAIYSEIDANLDKTKAYFNFAKRIEMSKKHLVDILRHFKYVENKQIISYGATSKSTTVFNYCNIGIDLVDYILDTTPEKWGKLSPGKHIPVINYEHGFGLIASDMVAFLGAWNYKDEILEKEKEYLRNGGKFITHVPYASVIE